MEGEPTYRFALPLGLLAFVGAAQPPGRMNVDVRSLPEVGRCTRSVIHTWSPASAAARASRRSRNALFHAEGVYLVTA